MKGLCADCFLLIRGYEVDMNGDFIWSNAYCDSCDNYRIVFNMQEDDL